MSAPVAVVAGAIANKLHHGGEAWVRLGWALGLRALGYDVYLLEGLDRPWSAETLETSEEAAYFQSVAGRFGFDERAALLAADGAAGAGVDSDTARQVLADTDLLVNVSGHLPLVGAAAGARRKVYVDVDPGYTQLWHAQGLDAGLDGHDAFVTVGLAVGSSACGLPTGGLDWIPTLPPIALDEWPAVPNTASEPRFTTVSSWRGAYGRVEHDGVLHGQKAHEFRRFLDLPRHAPFAFELALSIDEADRADQAALVAAGWHLVDPRVVAGDPVAYRRYVQGSGAEFSVAQGIYVESRCGWFSDRTGAYLSSGRPALVQDTGIPGPLTSDGLVTFATLPEAAAGAREIVRDIEARSEAARAFAEEHLDAPVVLGRLLERLERRS